MGDGRARRLDLQTWSSFSAPLRSSQATRSKWCAKKEMPEGLQPPEGEGSARRPVSARRRGNDTMIVVVIIIFILRVGVAMYRLWEPYPGNPGAIQTHPSYWSSCHRLIHYMSCSSSIRRPAARKSPKYVSAYIAFSFSVARHLTRRALVRNRRPRAWRMRAGLRKKKMHYFVWYVCATVLTTLLPSHGGRPCCTAAYADAFCASVSAKW